MRVARKHKQPPWTSEEIAILIDVYAREGINGAADALPERSWGAIQMMAHKLGVRSPAAILPERKPRLGGDDLEEAIRLREEQRWSFESIGRKFGVSEIAAQNAILIALCPRKGFMPAERDVNGRLLPEGLDRLRAMLRAGAKAIDIATQLGLSAGRIAEERRRYNALLKEAGEKPLPPPGNGARYSGARITHDVYDQVDALLMKGHGAPRVSEICGVSKTHVLRRRAKLIRALRAKGERLPGCDERGRRLAYKDSLSAVSEAQKETLRAEIMKGTPIAWAAKIAVVGASYAYKVRDELKAELERAGKQLPAIKRLGRVKAAEAHRQLSWLPAGKRNLIIYRKHLAASGNDPVEAKRRTIAELMPKAKPAPARKMTFEEKLAAIASGKARLVQNIPVSRSGPIGTLGGVASGLL